MKKRIYALFLTAIIILSMGIVLVIFTEEKNDPERDSSSRKEIIEVEENMTTYEWYQFVDTGYDFI